MRLKLKRLEVSTGRPIVFLNYDDAREIDVNAGERVQISFRGKKVIGRVDLIYDFLKRGESSLSEDIIKHINIKAGDKIDVGLVSRPDSAVFIAKKMNDKSLSEREIFSIIKDVAENALTEAEIAQFVVAVYKNGMPRKETIYLTRAMCKTGMTLKWKSKIVADKHSIGGIAGNRTTPIVVSICAAAGLVMPKTSSRAITSASGTADAVETVAKVDFPADELQRIVRKVGACLAWGGLLGLAPADDKLIKIERILRLDPESQLLASILSKKLSVGSTHVLIDIPYGTGAKVSRYEGEKLRRKFLWLGKKFGLEMKVVLTNGSQPIGNGIGPVLEMIDVLRVLRGKNPPLDLKKKALILAGLILEMTGKAKKNEGSKMAGEILNSGKALKKFDEIVEAQGRIRDGLKLAKQSSEVWANFGGIVRSIDNKSINFLAGLLGCPMDKGAGIYLHKHIGDSVKKGENLMTLYSESREKLDEVIRAIDRNNPMKIRRTEH